MSAQHWTLLTVRLLSVSGHICNFLRPLLGQCWYRQRPLLFQQKKLTYSPLSHALQEQAGFLCDIIPRLKYILIVHEYITLLFTYIAKEQPTWPYILEE